MGASREELEREVQRLGEQVKALEGVIEQLRWEREVEDTLSARVASSARTLEESLRQSVLRQAGFLRERQEAADFIAMQVRRIEELEWELNRVCSEVERHAEVERPVGFSLADRALWDAVLGEELEDAYG